MTIQTELTPSTSPERDTNLTERPVEARVADFVRSIARSPDYAEQRRAHIPHTEAFIATADSIINDEENELSSADRALFTLAKEVGGFIEADRQLSASRNNLGDRQPTNNQRYYQKRLKEEYLIPFNHSVKDLINEDPNLPIKGLSVTLARTYATVFAKSHVLDGGKPRFEDDIIKTSEVAFTLEEIIDSMRHEIAVETMASTLGVEYDFNISVEDDAKGVDVLIADSRGVLRGIDIKKSELAARRAHEKRSDSNAVSTGLVYADFTGVKNDTHGALTIPYETARLKAPDFYNRVLEVFDRSQQSTFGREAARRFVR